MPKRSDIFRCFGSVTFDCWFWPECLGEASAQLWKAFPPKIKGVKSDATGYNMFVIKSLYFIHSSRIEPGWGSIMRAMVLVSRLLLVSTQIRCLRRHPQVPLQLYIANVTHFRFPVSHSLSMRAHSASLTERKSKGILLGLTPPPRSQCCSWYPACQCCVWFVINLVTAPLQLRLPKTFLRLSCYHKSLVSSSWPVWAKFPPKTAEQPKPQLLFLLTLALKWNCQLLSLVIKIGQLSGDWHPRVANAIHHFSN